MENISLSRHSQKRMQQRAIKREWILRTLEFGREQYQKGGTYIYTLGRREVKKAAKEGFFLQHLCGLTVVSISSLSAEEIITVYWTSKNSSRVGEKR